MIPFLKHHGILGINARNLLYIRPYNKKKEIRFADDKLKSKQFLSARGIPVPKLFAVIRNQADLEKFDFNSLPSNFVLKPNLGYGGEGILPIVGRKDGMYEHANGSFLTQDELSEHISDILEGRFSLSGVMDTAFFEQRIICDDSIAKFSYKGLPDIRIVVHNLIPVMAMLRLPTKESDGKANLHQGALGVGIDIANGTTTHMVYKGKIIDEIPGLGSIKGLKIPHWDEMLLTAAKLQFITNLGYLAADLVLDRNIGPVLLEINARAGLAVQIANLAPLRKRLERIEGVQVKTPEKGVRIAQDMFGNRIEKDVKKVSGKEVIGSHEKVRILGGDEVRMVWASINPLLESTLIDSTLAESLNLKSEDEESESVKLKFSLLDSRIQTLAQTEDLSGKSYDLVIGRRDLNDFLIDPSKGKPTPSKLPHLKKTGEVMAPTGPNFTQFDKSIISIDRQLKLLYHLKPVNLVAEKETFLADPSYNPQFIYPDLQFDAFHLKEKLRKMKHELDDSSLSKLFLAKLAELEKKILVLEGIGADDFTDRSAALYSKPDDYLKTQAQLMLDSRPKNLPETVHEKVFSTEEAILEFEQALKSYGLDSWHIKIKESMVTDCLAGKSNVLFLRKGATFTESRLRMLVAHEIETHILTAENGKHQPYQLFNRGFADYLEIQEGLAVWNQEQVMMNEAYKSYRSSMLVFVVDFGIKHGFAETFDYCLKLGMDTEAAFRTTVKVKRGLEDTSKPGAFTKDLIYFSGYLQVRDYISKGGSLKDLYYGKYHLRDLEMIKSLPHLREPAILPHFV
ncbi:DUF1704 domain-containing protein [Candidatus Peregrinibacteria bacterium]|jgi:alpha-L-glutamate ligase-like protein/uncharacterized protein (TIGR02421 family)|nr:DUF1704 domain-containing protein [Candidatus Peregrinibacteria bacterium]MBT4631857.1 DUF1704 domain-containing protein [Candidatus Peregrinibacteria bacterium]MBT5516426.1 DUF1704 domain-containing protein [Candidatus Peregrinibacteria bacterium]MBT5824222.1 DUF1704 domain-containing protein [Candidatus Peregrinibacteria bacterium]